MSLKLNKFFKGMLIFLALATVVTTVFVVYLFLYSIDPETLFYYSDAKMVMPTNIILIVSTVVFLVPFFMRRQKAKSQISTGKNKLLGIFSLILALSFIASGIYKMSITFGSDSAGPFIIGFFQVLAAIGFIMFALNNLISKSYDIRAVALLPVLYGVVSLIITFMGLTQIANISVYLYEILEMVFAIVFFYYNARLISGLSNKREVFGGFAFGLSTAFYGIISTVPSLIAHLINNNVGKVPTLTDISYLVLSVYIIVMLITVLKKAEKE